MERLVQRHQFTATGAHEQAEKSRKRAIFPHHPSSTISPTRCRQHQSVNNAFLNAPTRHPSKKKSIHDTIRNAPKCLKIEKEDQRNGQTRRERGAVKATLPTPEVWNKQINTQVLDEHACRRAIVCVRVITSLLFSKAQRGRKSGDDGKLMRWPNRWRLSWRKSADLQKKKEEARRRSLPIVGLNKVSRMCFQDNSSEQIIKVTKREEESVCVALNQVWRASFWGTGGLGGRKVMMGEQREKSADWLGERGKKQNRWTRFQFE